MCVRAILNRLAIKFCFDLAFSNRHLASFAVFSPCLLVKCVYLNGLVINSIESYKSILRNNQFVNLKFYYRPTSHASTSGH